MYQTGDIIDTYVYRVSLVSGDFSYGTAKVEYVHQPLYKTYGSICMVLLNLYSLTISISSQMLLKMSMYQRTMFLTKKVNYAIFKQVAAE